MMREYGLKMCGWCGEVIPRERKLFIKLFLVVRYIGIHRFYVMDEVEYQDWEHLPWYRRQKNNFCWIHWRPWRNWWMSTVTPLWPVLHHSVTQPRPPDQNMQISLCWLSAVIVWCGTAANIFLVKQSGAEEFSGGAHMKEYGVALPPTCLLSGSDHYYSQIFINNWQDWQNCILSPWNVVKKLTGLPPACSLDCNGHLTFK